MQSEGERGNEGGFPILHSLSLPSDGGDERATPNLGREGMGRGAEVNVCCQEEGRFTSPVRDEGCLSTWLTAPASRAER